MRIGLQKVVVLTKVTDPVIAVVVVAVIKFIHFLIYLECKVEIVTLDHTRADNSAVVGRRSAFSSHPNKVRF